MYLQVVRTKDRCEVITKAFLALFVIILIIVYNEEFYKIVNQIHWQHVRISSTNSNQTTSNVKTQLTSSSIPEGYLVWSENCHMASVDPYLPDYLEAFDYFFDNEQNPVPNCTTPEPLVTKSYNKTLQSYVLHINYELKDIYLNGTDDDISCFSTNIFRDGDKGYGWSQCQNLEQDFVVSTNVDYMIIECNGTMNAPTFYHEAMSFFHDRADIDDRIRNNNGSAKPFGILMFGADSISQFNLRRVMPLTYEYFQTNNWFELSGYNKIEDNTFPNLMAVLAGIDLETTNELCHYHEKGGLDKCPTLFKLFREQGFVTAYSEDSVEISTFDYLLPGFQEPPTDYYQRPLLLAVEERLPLQKLSGLTYCAGPRRSGEYIYDFGVEFAERYLGQSIFGLFWANSFSHNNWVDPADMDERMVEYFHYMESREIFDNNVVIIFSDHGARWGFLRQQKEGYNEERLPMFFMRLPQWFQDQNPEIVQSLMLNKNRLTSPYDIHVTLKHLAMMSLGKTQPIGPPISCPTCQTLFKPVAENRTCEMAGITDHWCTCIPFEVMDRDSDEMVNMTNLIIDEMNNYLMENGFGEKCAKLIFERNVEANLKLDLHTDVHKSRIQEYRMNFVANPNEAVYDATFLYDTETNAIAIDVTEISRLNRYAEDSACIEDKIAKKYCICKDSIRKNKQL